MEMIKRGSSLFFFLIIILIFNHSMLSREIVNGNQDENKIGNKKIVFVQNVDLQDVKKYIETLRKSGERLTESEVNYVLENINRKQLIEVIENWQLRNKNFILAQETKITILVDYLLTELSSIKVLPPLLNSLRDGGKSISFGQNLKTQVAAVTFKTRAFGRLKIETNLNSVKVEINNKVFPGEVGKDKLIVLTQGSHLVKVMQDRFTDCTSTVNLVAGNVSIVQCTLTQVR